MNKTYAELNGAWEERGVIGKRIEIDGQRITVLWRNAPVLETTFKTKEIDGQIELILKNSGLRYKGAASDYAEIEHIRFTGENLAVCEYFPISGESNTVLTKTENSRFGNYEIVSDVLPQLQGNWKSTDGIYEIEIKKDEMRLHGKRTKICVLREKNPHTPSDRYILADQDPSVFGLEGFGRFAYDGERLSASMHVCDAPSVLYVFERE